MDKTKLDEILDKHKAQPVGHGYIDIIVSKDNYKELIADLVNNGFKIESISWWEWCEGKKEIEYGLGGPESIYYDGRFSEIPANIDDIKLNKEMNAENIIEEIINKIETKTIAFSDETVTFEENNWLTPALWLDVPEDWRNKYCA